MEIIFAILGLNERAKGARASLGTLSDGVVRISA
jgi:hypothetical protein